MPAGPILDRVVAEHIFNREIKGKAPAYSTKIEQAIHIIEHIPVGVGQMGAHDSRFKASRPYWAGDESVLTVVSASPELALCKAALLMKYEAIAKLKAGLNHATANETADVPKKD